MAAGEIVDLADIPYIDRDQMDARRFLPTLMFFDETWRVWAEIEPRGKFIEFAQAWPAEAVYFGRQPERQTDFYSVFLNVFSQRANLLPLGRTFSGILDDIHNLATSFAKLDLIFESGRDQPAGTNRMAATEVEYVLLVCRSIFDLLQETIAKYWEQVKPFGENVQKKALKQSFSDMALLDNRPKSEQELMERFLVPQQLAACYVRHAPVFLKIRTARDRLVHGGNPVDTVFRGDKEFIIQKRLGPFGELDIWREGELEKNDLAPLRPVLGMIAYSTLAACEDFANVLASIIQLLPPTVPKMNLYVRGHFDEMFAKVIQDADSRFAEGRTLFPPSRETQNE
ncbi:hypothetical protein ABIA99_003489 [Bradyrhizobium sp. LB12.1]|uniref:hypothetical protein n=1 Tax=Bradyrhizobium sp. LB12.1 TaxID=3156327 RepID=UPI00339AE4B1